MWRKVKSASEAAQLRQKRYADQHRHDEHYVVGDQVLLSTSHLKVIGTERSPKLAAKWIGPFEVIGIVNENSYRLRLPSAMRVHPVINISRLRRYKRSDRFPSRPNPLPRPPPVVADAAAEPEWEVERVLAKRKHGRSWQYLIKWLGYPNEESSWESAAGLNCPDLVGEFEMQQMEEDNL
jgi:hypothetical protein